VDEGQARVDRSVVTAPCPRRRLGKGGEKARTCLSFRRIDS
jgi:hypothetical protein